jgi:hypothetical protein
MFQSSAIRKGGKCWRRTPFRQDYTEKRLKQYPSGLEGVRRLKGHLKVLWSKVTKEKEVQSKETKERKENERKNIN